MTIDDILKAIDGLLDGLSDISGIRSEEKIEEQYQKASEECMKVSETVCLLKGDLSGIQNFIKNVNQSEDVDGGVAKRLRGRSFYISAICAAVAHEFVSKLNLSKDCILSMSGGKFFIIIPNTVDVVESVKAIQKELEEWLWAEMWGGLYMNIAVSEPKSPEELNRDYTEIAKKLQTTLEQQKLNKFVTVFDENDQIDIYPAGEYEDWVFRPKHYTDECHSCRSLPALGDYAETSRGEKEDLCRQCNENERIARAKNLPENNFLTFENKGDVQFHDNYAVLGKGPCGIRIPAYSPKYVPSRIDEDVGVLAGRQLEDHKRENLCETRCSLYQTEGEMPEECGWDVLSTRFHCLAAHAEGDKQIAVMAGDVDNLSVIMNSVEGMTLEDMMCMSEGIYFFFAHFLVDELLEKYNTYLIYSGGDDFTVVGPWDQVLELANELYKKFNEFANDKKPGDPPAPSDITFSSGLRIARPQTPIFDVTSIADDLLHEAKESKADRKSHINVMGTIIAWEDFDRLLTFAKKVRKAVEDEKITPTFIYGLYSIYDDYRKWKVKGDVHGLTYLGRLASSIERNITDDKVAEWFKPLLYSYQDENLLPYFRFVLDWVNLKLRTENEEVNNGT